MCQVRYTREFAESDPIFPISFRNLLNPHPNPSYPQKAHLAHALQFLRNSKRQPLILYLVSVSSGRTSFYPSLVSSTSEIERNERVGTSSQQRKNTRENATCDDPIWYIQQTSQFTTCHHPSRRTGYIQLNCSSSSTTSMAEDQHLLDQPTTKFRTKTQ